MLSSLWKSPALAANMPPPTNTEKEDPPAPLVSSWRARADAGEPVAVVRVRNLQGGAIAIGRDAWGRPGRLQPVLLSSEVSFAAPFAGSDGANGGGSGGGDDGNGGGGGGGNSGVADKLDAGTVHYGTLSQTLLGSLEMWSAGQKSARGGGAVAAGEVVGGEGEEKTPRTADVCELLWVRMTGRVVDGSRVALPPDQLPVLDFAKLRSLALTVSLPKASLLGAGVSLTTTASFREGVPRDDKRGGDGGGKDKEKEKEKEGEGGEKMNSKNPLRSYARSLRIQGLHVPTLIGVNANERKAKQMVVADVEIDRFDVVDDIYSDIETLIVETMEASSFETLEALATQLANKILLDFRIGDNPAPMKDRGWQVKVCLEKPIAVPFAECPSVEVRMGP
ncbi:uncharacterized protein GGS25DRAFT_516734 [Hypoxylon fragiforme]|uniref:uncharacterized protein n=1 Tax=Hypoxylon fragiforme TaxID=63214 RepID=UPI0020C69459|nr:uncharacterized protein GGS25DRAFT_516734 [Hypoxylon fragiforme]KAI2613873.1 hypothetical protein GGS25DRAFT_516734 [Hypoxylon fragiforme]